MKFRWKIRGCGFGVWRHQFSGHGGVRVNNGVQIIWQVAIGPFSLLIWR